MSPQADYVVSNGTGAAVRSDINGQLAAIVSNNSGASAPATTYAYMLWADTSTNLLKLRNGANSAWITVGDLTAANLGLATLASPTFTGTATIPTLTVSTAANIPLGSAASPTLYFTGDSNTGLYSPGADQVAISTGGSGRLFVDASGRVGIGTTNAGYQLSVNGSIYIQGSSTAQVRMQSASGSGSWYYWGENTVADRGVLGYAAGSGDLVYRSGAYDFASGSERLRITSAGLVGIGDTAPGHKLVVRQNNSGGVAAIHLPEDESTILGSTANTNIKMGGNMTVSASGILGFNTSGSERARIDSSGRWLLGTSSARSMLGITPGVQSEGTSFAQGTLSLTVNSTAGGAYPILSLAKSGGTTLGSNTLVSNGDTIGKIFFTAADGVDMDSAIATIEAVVDGGPGANDLPGRLVFSTTADGASSPTERMKIYGNGAVAISSSPYLYPVTDNATKLGLSGYRWSEVWAANGTIQTSDKRTKTNIANATLGSDFIKSLRPVSYKWIEGGKRDTGKRDENNNYIYESVPGERTHWGFIAQEVKEATDAAGVDFGGWILTDKDDPDSQQALRYDQFIAPLTKALQEALAEIDVLKAKVAALESA